MSKPIIITPEFRSPKKIIFDIETTGLDSFNDRITCICLFIDNQVTSIWGPDEKKLLEDFWKKISDFDVLISFNGDSFDIPFLIKRSLINRVRTKKIESLDLRKKCNGFWFSYNSKENGKLSDWAKVMGIEVATDSGASMRKYFIEEKWEEIEKHCKEDVTITSKLYELCKFCNVA